MKALHILKCSDPLFWYKDYVGIVVPLVRVCYNEYISREPSGYTNIVRLEDAEIIEVDYEPTLRPLPYH